MGLHPLRWGLLFAALALTAQISLAQNATASVDVCPAAKWRALPFLRIPAPPTTIVALVDSATSGGDIKTAGVAYLRTNLVPKVGANVLFFVLAVLFLVIFLLWRVLRWCCHVLCCRSSCDAKRSHNDPHDLLFSRRMAVLKVFMFLFGLVAIILFIYGLADTPKGVITKAFDTVDLFDTYLTRATGYITDLEEAVGNVSVVIDDFQAIVQNDVDIPGFRTNIAVIQTFLGTVTPPATLAASVSGLATDVASLDTAITALGASLPSVGPSSAMATALTAVGGAMASAAAMAGPLTTLDASIAAMPATGGPDPTTGNAAVSAFSTAMLAVSPGMGGTWATTLTSLSTALDALNTMESAGNPLTATKNALSAVNTLVSQISGTDIPALAASLNSVTSQWATAQPAVDWIVAQLIHVNATVMQLSTDMQAAYDSAASVSTGLASFFSSSPTPASLATSLTTTTASGLAMPAATPTLLSGLSAQAAVLNGVQFSTGPGSNGELLKLWVTAAKADITAAAGAFNTMASARATYFGAPSAANYDALKNAANAYRAAAATATLRSKLAEQASAPCAAANYVTPSATIAAAGAAAFTGLSPYIASAHAAVAAVPTLAPYATALSAVTLPAASLFDAPKAALDAIDAAVMTGGNTAKAQVASTLSSFSGATTMLDTQVLGRLDSIQVHVKPIALKADGYRYQGSMALYALPMFVVLLLLFCALAVNYHFGTNLSTLLLLILLVLGFILAFVIALVMAVLGDVCPAVEPLLLSKVPSNLAPIANYYLEGQGASVKAVLKTAGIVDVDGVLAQVVSGKDDVVASITALYTFRQGPNAVLTHLNATVDDAIAAVNSLLGAASYDQVFPLYSAVKGLLCCTIPDSFASMWIALTIGGIMAWFLVLLTFFYIGRLDKLPRSDCCGCSCHTHSKYEGGVAPGPRPQHNLGHPIFGDVEAGRGAAAAAPAISVPLNQAGWEEGTVVAELVVRAPGGGQSPDKMQR